MGKHYEEIKEKLEKAKKKVKKISEILEEKGDKVGLYTQLEWENLKGEYDELKASVEKLSSHMETKGKEKLDDVNEKVKGIREDVRHITERAEMIGKVRKEKYGRHLEDLVSKAELEALSLKYEYENIIKKFENIIDEHRKK